jgi:transcriptional regulator with XRE-family HTH domain
MKLDTIAKRLEWARRQTKRWETPTDAARAHGWTVSTYLGHENGDRNPSRAMAKKYAKAYRVRWEWLLEGEGNPTPKGPPKGIVRGYVGAGAEVAPLNDDSLGDQIDLPPGAGQDIIPVRVSGDSMYPRYFDGEYLFYLPEQRPPTEMIGRECVVSLADGRIFVKILRKGSGKGVFNLESWNAPPMIDQTVEWAAPVRWRG